MVRIRTLAMCGVLSAWLALVGGAGSVAAARTKVKPTAARIEIVNVVGRPDGSTPTVELTSRVATSARKPKRLVVAEFGQPSSFVKVPANTGLQLVASDDAQGSLYIDPLKKGTRLTIVVYGTQNGGETGMQQLTVVNKGSRRKAGDVVEWPDVDASKATAMVFTGPLLGVLPDDAANSGYYFVTPGAGCLRNVDESAQDSGFGGNVPEFFVIDPGSTEVAGSSEGCQASPVIGPETLTASAGDHIGVIAYGTGPSDLHLFVLRFAVA